MWLAMFYGDDDHYLINKQVGKMPPSKFEANQTPHLCVTRALAISISAIAARMTIPSIDNFLLIGCVTNDSGCIFIVMV